MPSRVTRRLRPLVLIAVAGCNKTVTDIACGDVRVAAIGVSVQDSVTGARFPFHDLTMLATDGAFRDSLIVSAIVDPGPGTTPTFPLAWERPGTYQVSVAVNGYATWITSGIVVLQNGCHVATQRVTAKLVHQ